MEKGIFTINPQGFAISGEGTFGSLIRVYLYPSKSEYSLELKNESQSLGTSTPEQGKMLYFRLKRSRTVVISNPTEGRIKVY